jgi:tetratricopeptide (TPR) repeat protein
MIEPPGKCGFEMMKIIYQKLSLLLVLFCILQNAHSKTVSIDSIINLLRLEKRENQKVDIIYSATGVIGESDPLEGFTIARRLLKYSREEKDFITETYAKSYLGKMYGVSGNLQKGLENALAGKQMAERTENEKLISITSSLLGLIYKTLSNYPKSIACYLSAEESGKKANYPQAQIWAYQSLSEIYLALDQSDSALMYAQRDYELSTRIKYHDFLAYTYINLGAIQSKMGNHAVASDIFDLAIQQGIKSGSPRQLTYALTAKAEYFYSNGQKDSAIMYAKKAIVAVEHTAFKSYIIKPAQLLLNSYKEKNVDSAFKYSELFRTTSETVFNKQSALQTQILTFEDELHQRKITEDKLKAEQERRLNIQYFLLALGIIAFVIILLLISRRVITNPKWVGYLGILALLLVFEFLNLLLHPFLERITHHSPFLMLLGLVCIGAFLVPLHHKAEVWAIKKLVEKNKESRLAEAKKTIRELEEEKVSKVKIQK